MTSIDHIIKKLNINSVNFNDSGRASDDIELRIQDVFAALGFGHLSPGACYIGLAVERKDDVDISQANKYAAEIAGKVFEREGWSATKPYQNRVRAMVNMGILDPTEVSGKKAFFGEYLKFKMGRMALYELRGPHIIKCPRCLGSGMSTTKENKPCRCPRCHGNYRIKEPPLNNKVHANRVDIKYDAWMKNWRYRYQTIQGEMNHRISEFYEHLDKKC